MKDNRSVRWSDKSFELAIELDNIISTLNNFAYNLENRTEKRIVPDEINSLLFCTCNHLERIKADLERLEDYEQPQKLTEVKTEVKTLYL